MNLKTAFCLVVTIGVLMDGPAMADGPCDEVAYSPTADRFPPSNRIIAIIHSLESTGKPPKLSLVMMPGRLFTETVQVDPGAHPPGGKHVEFTFWLMLPKVTVGGDKGIDHAELSLCRGRDTLETLRVGAAALKARQHKRIAAVMKARKKTLLSSQHHFVVPARLGVDGLVYRVAWSADGKRRRGYRIDVESGRPKTRMRLPLKGMFKAFSAHTLADHHRADPAQWYAFDFLSLDKNGAWLNDKKGDRNESFVGWGQPLLAVAGGTITDCRDDIPDNAKPMDLPNLKELYKKYGPKERTMGGNFVVIDHGNGEFSYYAHLRKGSLKVKKGQKVKQGQVLGQMGNSGNSGAPHLHYHLMACATPFQCTGIPVRFENVSVPFTKGPHVYTPARGIPVQDASDGK